VNDGGDMAGFGAQSAYAGSGGQQTKDGRYNQAKQSYDVVKQGAFAAVQELQRYVREGPAGVSILCFFGGIVTTIVGAFGLLNVWQSLTSPFSYVLNIYLTMFGIVTFLLEADVVILGKMTILGKAAPLIEVRQNELFAGAQVLKQLRGRALFYIFVGSLAITQCWFCPLFLVGMWNVLMGALCGMMSLGINPADHMNMNQQSRSEDPNAPLFDANRYGPGP